MRWIKSLIFLMVPVMLSGNLKAQSGNRYFCIQSPADPASKGYGSVVITADKSPVLIQTILANGEQVKALSIQFSKGATYKLAPAQSTQILNYVGSSLSILIPAGESAIISFMTDSKSTGNRSIRVCGENLNQL